MLPTPASSSRRTGSRSTGRRTAGRPRAASVVPELREVRVQVSFSRFDSIGANLQGEYDFAGRKVKPAVLTLPTGNQKWLPAAEVRGEGIFVELDDEKLTAWEGQRTTVRQRAEQLVKRVRGGAARPSSLACASTCCTRSRTSCSPP